MTRGTRPRRAILVVSPGGRDATGGICRVVDDLAAAWRRAGYDPPMRVIDSGGMASGFRQPHRLLGALLRVASAALRGEAALLHVHVAAGGSLVRKALFVGCGRLLRVPVVLHLHAADLEVRYQRRGPIGQALIGALFRAADTVVVLGERARGFVADGLGVPAGRLALVPNGVTRGDPRPFRSVKATYCQLVFAGALTTRKGLDTLLAALALGSAPVRLDVVGNGEIGAWAREADRLGVADRVRFLGWRDNRDTRALIAAADVLVLPSRAEAMPLAILEAMAEGVAVIATGVGEVADLVLHGETGLLVPPADPAALAEAIAALAADASRCRRLGRAGQAHAVARFGLDDTVGRLLTVLAATAARHTLRAGPTGRAPAGGTAA